MIYKDEKLHNKYVINIIFDGASLWNYLQTTEMGSLMLVIDLPQLTGHRRSRGARSRCFVLAMDASPWNYLQTTEMGSLMCYCLVNPNYQE